MFWYFLPDVQTRNLLISDVCYCHPFVGLNSKADVPGYLVVIISQVIERALQGWGSGAQHAKEMPWCSVAIFPNLCLTDPEWEFVAWEVGGETASGLKWASSDRETVPQSGYLPLLHTGSVIELLKMLLVCHDSETKRCDVSSDIWW